MDAGELGEAKERVVGIADLVAQGSGDENGLIGESRGRLVTMHESDSLSDKNVSEKKEERGGKRGQENLVINGQKRQIIYFESIGEVPHSLPSSVPENKQYTFIRCKNKCLGTVRIL